MRRLLSTLVVIGVMGLGVQCAGAQDSLGDPLPEGALQRLGTLRMRYATTVAGICYLSDSRCAVAAGREVEIWDLSAGQLVSRHTVAATPISGMEPRSDGKALLLTEWKGMVREWDVEAAQELRAWQTGQKQLGIARYSPDGTRVLAVGAVPPTVKEFDLAGGRQLIEIAGTMQIFSAGIYSEDGKSAYIGGGYRFIMAHYDLQTGEQINEWVGDYQAHDLALSPDGERLLVGYRYRASEYQLDGYRHLRKFDGHLGGAVNACRYCADGQQVLTGARDGSIRKWALDPTKVLLQWFPHQHAVTQIEVSPDERRALSAGGRHDDFTVAETSLDTGETTLPWQRHTGMVTCVATVPGAAQAVSGSTDGTIRLWDTQSGTSLGTAEVSRLGVFSVAVSPDGSTVAAGSGDGAVREYRLPGLEPIRELTQHLGYVRSLKYKHGSWGSEDAVLLSSADDGSIRAWTEMRNQWPLNVLTGHRGGVLSVDISSDNSLALSGGRDSTIRLWELRSMGAQATPAPRATCKQHRGWVEAVCFIGDTTRALSGGRDGIVREWDTQTGQVLREFAHGGWVRTLACTPDGATACAGGEDNRITIWDLNTGELKREFTGHEGDVLSLAITDDGERLVSASQDTTLLVWDVP